MRFKLDENLPAELAQMFREAGHDAVTVLDQDLVGATDADLLSVCIAEGRVIVTFDTGFADIRRYPPGKHPGVIVFRLESQARGHVSEVAARLLKVLSANTLEGHLWIADESRIRVRD